MEKRREVLRVMLFVSRPRSTKEIHSPSATVQMFPGRPNVDTLLGMEMGEPGRRTWCVRLRPRLFSDEVRKAVRNRQYQGAIDFVEEAFSCKIRQEPIAPNQINFSPHVHIYLLFFERRLTRHELEPFLSVNKCGAVSRDFYLSCTCVTEIHLLTGKPGRESGICTI